VSLVAGFSLTMLPYFALNPDHNTAETTDGRHSRAFRAHNRPVIHHP
jgi:hypothetical protein